MSILDEFDPNSNPLFTPEHIYGKREKIADVCIVTFHHRVLEKVLEEYAPAAAAAAATANGKVNIYLLENGGKKVLFYMSPIGAPAAGAIMHEVNVLTGAEKFIVFGSCGVLAPEKCAGKIIVPTESYRDEGFSYHFFPAGDYIIMKNSEAVEKHLKAGKVPYVSGRNWTTDAIYRETPDNIARHRKDGCISVEMEAAGLQAVADYREQSFIFSFSAEIFWAKAGILEMWAAKRKKNGNTGFLILRWALPRKYSCIFQ